MLVTDILFPSKFAKWRIEESKAFIDKYKADFLVFKVDSYANIVYDIDYDEMKDYYNLHEYNIIIFDKKYNHLNKYNTRIDGTKFNCANGFSYLFTRKETFDLTSYKSVYHIFLSMYERFNNSFKFNPSKQFIHLYPGGGLAGKSAIQKIHKEANVISTNHMTTQWLKDFKHTNYVDVFGGTLLPKDNVIIPKKKNDGTLRICFSSMGAAAQKGASVYKLLAEKYKLTYPKHNVEFVSIGNSLPSAAIKPYAPMSIKELDKFYSNNVDVIINLENGTAFNGWPLGCEAMLQGVVLITTDVYNSNKHTGCGSDMLFIVDKHDTKSMLKIVAKLHDDRQLLFDMSNRSQQYTNNWLSYDNQQVKIFDFIDNKFTTQSMLIYQKFSPKYFTNDTIYNIKEKKLHILTQDNVVIKNNDIKTFIFDNIRDNKSSSFVRYNDGEWICMLRIKENNCYDIHKVKWDKDAETFMDNGVTPIVSSIPYYVGVSTEVLKKDYMVKNIFPYIKSLDLFDGGLFARWQLDGTILELLDLLKTKNVIIVGPDYLSELKTHLNFTHIVTHNNLKLNRTSMTEKNGVRDSCAVVKQYPELFESLNKNIVDNCVVLYACSFAAKKLIHDFHTRNIVQLDIGAAFDNMCGLQTRPWHFQ